MEPSLLGGRRNMPRINRAVWSCLLTGFLGAFIALLLLPQTGHSLPSPGDDTPRWTSRTTIEYGDTTFEREPLNFTDQGVGANTQGPWVFSHTEDYSDETFNDVSCKNTLTFTVNPYGDDGGQSAYRVLRELVGVGGNRENPRCSIIDQDSNGNGTLTAVANAGSVNANGNDGTNGEGVPTSTTNEEDEEEGPGTACEAFGSPLGWAICPIVNGLLTFTENLDFWISDLMTVDTGALFNPTGANENEDTSDAYYTAWSAFRTIALGLVVIAALVIIIASTFGFEMLDAYTIRKAMPRVLLAVILIALSWDILEFLVTLSNDVGNGVRALIYAPFSELEQFQIRVGQQSALLLLLGGGLTFMGILGLLSFAFTAAIAVLIAFLVLVLREMIIVLLVILAPIALTLLILPNTQKYWQFWQNTLTAMLIAFPIIAAFIATGRVFSAVAYQNGDANTIDGLIAFVAYFLPYFLLPLAFRMAGGLLAQMGNLANNSERGMFDRLKKYRQGQAGKRWGEGGKYREPIERRAMQTRADVANRLQKGLGSNQNATWAGRMAGRGLARGIGGRNMEAQMSAKRAQVSKEMKDQIATGEDDEIRALTARNSTRFVDTDGKVKYKSLSGKTYEEGFVKAARRRWGNDSFAQQAALSYEMSKATEEPELRSIADNYNEWATERGLTDKQKTGNWIGAAYEQQNSNLQFKNMRLQSNGKMAMDAEGYKKFASEIYEKRGSYNLSQMSANTITELGKAYNTGDAQTQQQVRAIAENFMSRYGGGGTMLQAPGEEGQPPVTVNGGGATGSNVQTHTPGAAHVAERVNQLARDVGVYTSGPPPAKPPGPGPAPTNPQR